MSPRIAIGLGVAVGFFLLCASGFAVGFSGLGVLGTQSHATDVSTGGIVAGTSDGQAFRWTPGGGMVGLGAGTGGPYGRVVVSGNGAVVAGSHGDGIFRWTAGGGAVGISGATNCGEVSAINADGSILTGFGGSPQPFDHHCRWTLAAGMGYVSGLPEQGQNAARTMLNLDGTALTWGSYAVGPNPMGFLSTTTGGTLPLCDPDTGPGCMPERMTQDASVVVGWLGQHAFRWTAASGVVDLGDLPGFPGFALPRNLRDDGARFVGFGGADSDRQALVWDDVHGMRRVVDLMTSVGIALPAGWKLRDATAVNWGYLVGDGEHLGQQEAWRIELPGPFALLTRVRWLMMKHPPTLLAPKLRATLISWVSWAQWLLGMADLATDPKAQAALRLQAKGLVQQALERTDGCAKRGAVDGANGPNVPDWIPKCDAQAPVFASLGDVLVDL